MKRNLEAFSISFADEAGDSQERVPPVLVSRERSGGEGEKFDEFPTLSFIASSSSSSFSFSSSSSPSILSSFVVSYNLRILGSWELTGFVFSFGGWRRTENMMRIPASFFKHGP